MRTKIAEQLRKHHDFIVYVLLGVATTAVNFAVYYPLLNFYNLTASVSNCIAWIVSVLFAFATNKVFAFKSLDWSFRVMLPEFGKFLGCRLGSGIFETGFLAITVDLLLWSGNVMKLLISVVVVIANYVTSKYIVFKKRRPASN